jgi:hypothetical protein
MVLANIERLPGHLHRRPDVHAVRMTKLLPIFALTSKLVDVDPVIGCQLWSNWQQNTPYPSTRAVHTDTTGLPWRLDFVPGGFPRPNDAHQAIDGAEPSPGPDAICLLSLFVFDVARH